METALNAGEGQTWLDESMIAESQCTTLRETVKSQRSITPKTGNNKRERERHSSNIL